MNAVATTTMTVREILDALARYNPAVEGDELAFDDDIDIDPEEVVRIAQTGIRALLTGRRWFGCDGKTGAVLDLNPAMPIPRNITLLAVEGDPVWDRLTIDRPELFGPNRATN